MTPGTAKPPVPVKHEELACTEAGPFDFEVLNQLSEDAAEKAEILQDFMAQTRSDLANLKTVLEMQDITWRERSLELTVSVNLSLASLTDTMLADRITQVVRTARLDPRHMMLEITESAAMTEVAYALENLARLRMRGFGLSIDDYGTGYSSMQQLTRIPFTELKIDQGFVTGCVANKATRAIIESSVGMARNMGIKSVAEGVESQADWDALKATGCDVVQGYFIAKPMDGSSFLDFCATYKPVC
jgi:EAL domain-containing protein (putative c-di-GMP-specific phosphodiesterase class I)